MRARLRFALPLLAASLISCNDQRLPTAIPDDARQTSTNGEACGHRVNNTVDKLLECVTIDGVRAHQQALQNIADANGGTRVSGTPGYNQSVDYVADKLRGAGYDVTIQPFGFETFVQLTPALLEQVTPGPTHAIPTVIFTYSGSGDVTAPVTHVSGGADPGCDPADFLGFPAGHIALIRRGACTFALKATNAYNAGATAVVIYNNVAGPINGTLGADFALNFPVVSVTQDAGLNFLVTPALVLHVRTNTFHGEVTSYNVLAETQDGDPDNVVMVGAHLDAVAAGPGINDNGSGSAAVLETALQMAKVKPRNKVRFAWWGAEESGLVGSRYYVDHLGDADLNRISLYLNFDMIGSPNYVYFLYDGDNSLGGSAHPSGSGPIEQLFESYFTGRGLATKGISIVGSSDHTPFAQAGVPVGGVFTGAGGIKTAEEASLWGGTAGIAYDPCYHQACDTFANVSQAALDVSADAVALATLTYAMNTSTVNGVSGKGNFKPKP